MDDPFCAASDPLRTFLDLVGQLSPDLFAPQPPGYRLIVEFAVHTGESGRCMSKKLLR